MRICTFVLSGAVVAAALLSTTVAQAVPAPSPCVDGSNSCILDTNSPTPPADMNDKQQAVYCYGLQLWSREQGIPVVLPKWCERWMKDLPPA